METVDSNFAVSALLSSVKSSVSHIKVQMADKLQWVTSPKGHLHFKSKEYLNRGVEPPWKNSNHQPNW